MKQLNAAMNRKRLLSIVVMLFLALVLSIPVAAMNTGFQLEDLSESETIAFLAEADIQILDIAPEKGNIISFNVSDDRIALAIEDCGGYNRKSLCIYNLDGQFLQGYSFQTREFGMDFDGDNILIYFDDKDIAVCLSTTGQVEEVYRIPYGINREYWTQHVYARERKIDGMEYRLQNGNGVFSVFPAADYAQLVVMDAAGNERILYDNSAQRNTNHILMGGFLILLATICGITFAMALRRGRKNSGDIFKSDSENNTGDGFLPEQQT